MSLLISILAQYLVNYYIFIIYYLQNLADRVAESEKDS